MQDRIVVKNYLHFVLGALIAASLALVVYAFFYENWDIAATYNNETLTEKKRSLNAAFINCLLIDKEIIGSPIAKFPGLEEGADHVAINANQTRFSMTRLLEPKVLPTAGPASRSGRIPYQAGDRVLFFALPKWLQNNGKTEGFYPTSYAVYIRNDQIFAIGLNGYNVVH